MNCAHTIRFSLHDCVLHGDFIKTLEHSLHVNNGSHLEMQKLRYKEIK